MLQKFDLGDGGLVPITIYEDDKETPIDGPFFLLNIGPPRRCFVPEQSNKIAPFSTMKRNGEQVWSASAGRENYDVAVTAAALQGSDLWFDPILVKGGEGHVYDGATCGRITRVKYQRRSCPYSLSNC